MKMIGEYTLLQRLGRGGMGQIWRARREVLGGASTTVAIKLMTHDIGPDSQVRKHFIKEARLSLLLRSSNIVRVFDVAQTHEGVAYIVMEWIDGLNLAQLCKKMWEKGEQLSSGAIAYILAEIAKGIMHAHELRANGANLTIIHRDISPHNIMLSRRGEVKLLDFGIARIATEDTSGTLAGAGKIRYMPPEQFRGKTRGPTVDLFPVGAILHELLDQRKFRFGALDQMQLYGLSLAGIVPPLSPDTQPPPKLAELRERLLSYEPRERPQSAREVFEELIAWEGYANATLELEDMVRRHLGPPFEPNTDSSYTPTHASPTAAAPAASPQQPADTPNPPAGKPPTGKPPVRFTPTPVPTLALTSPNVNLAPRRRTAAFTIAGTAVLGLALLGSSYYARHLAAGVMQEAPPLSLLTPPAPVEQSPSAAEPSTPAPLVEATDPIKAVEARTPASPVQEPDLAVSSPVESAAAPPSPKPVAIARTKLSVSREGLHYAEVKIGKHVFNLNVSTRTLNKTLPAGEYKTKYRTRCTDPWQEGPPLQLKKGRLNLEVSPEGLFAH